MNAEKTIQTEPAPRLLASGRAKGLFAAAVTLAALSAAVFSSLLFGADWIYYLTYPLSDPAFECFAVSVLFAACLAGLLILFIPKNARASAAGVLSLIFGAASGLTLLGNAVVRCFAAFDCAWAPRLLMRVYRFLEALFPSDVLMCVAPSEALIASAAALPALLLAIPAFIAAGKGAHGKRRSVREPLAAVMLSLPALCVIAMNLFYFVTT